MCVCVCIYICVCVYIYIYIYSIYIYIYIYNLHNGECASVFNALLKTRRVSAFAFLRGLSMQLLQSRNTVIYIYIYIYIYIFIYIIADSTVSAYWASPVQC